MYQSYFRCFRGCPGQWPLYEVIYTCPTCGGLLEVAHDVDAAAQSLRRGLDAPVRRTRRHHATSPTAPACGATKNGWCPTCADENIVSTFEGNTNLFWAARLGEQIGVPDLWVKQSGNSHTGSFKDLGMTVLVSVVKQMMAQGSTVQAVACASTGDTSAALAAYGAAAGIPTIVFLPQGKVSSAQLIQPIANGATVLALDTDFDGCMRIVKEVTKDNSIYLANSMNSLRIEGQKTVGIEIVQQFDWEVPDWIVIPVGNLGNISALGKGLLADEGTGHHRQAAAAGGRPGRARQSLLSILPAGFHAKKCRGKPHKTLASAIQIGDPVSYEKAVAAVQQFDGIVEQATEHELADAAARADRTGLYTCPHTGVALAALIKLVARGVIQSHEQVVVISTAHGLKFTSFKVGYHDDELDEVEAHLANPPIYLPADVDVVKRTLEKRLNLF